MEDQFFLDVLNAVTATFSFLGARSHRSVTLHSSSRSSCPEETSASAVCLCRPRAGS